MGISESSIGWLCFKVVCFLGVSWCFFLCLCLFVCLLLVFVFLRCLGVSGDLVRSEPRCPDFSEEEIEKALEPVLKDILCQVGYVLCC